MVDYAKILEKAVSGRPGVSLPSRRRHAVYQNVEKALFKQLRRHVPPLPDSQIYAELEAFVKAANRVEEGFPQT